LCGVSVAVAAPTATTRIVVQEFQDGPTGDTQLLAGQHALLNDAGQILFDGFELAQSAGAYDGPALYLADHSGFTRLVTPGQRLATGEYLHRFGSVPLYNLNNNGDITFGGTIVNGGNDLTLFRVIDGGIEKIARIGDPAPGDGEPLRGFRSPILDESGAVTFIGAFQGVRNVLFRTRADGMTDIVAESGTSVPGALGDLRSSWFGVVQQDAVGHTTSQWRLAVTSTGIDPAIVTEVDDQLVIVAQQGGPGPAGYSFSGPGAGFDIGLDAGGNNDVLFRGTVTHDQTSERVEGLFIWRDEQLRFAATAGEATPAGDAFFAWPRGVGINGAGEVAFTAGLVDAAGETLGASALFRNSADGRIEVARSGDMTSTGDVFKQIKQAQMNEAGQILVHVDLEGTLDGSNQDGVDSLWMFDDRIGLLRVVRVGDPVDASAIRSINEEPQWSVSSWEHSFNNKGQVAYRYRRVDGRYGIALWTPPSLEDLVPGDANLDGTVNLADFGVLRANFGRSQPAYFTTGDFTGDGIVNLADFGLLRANFGGSVADVAVVDAWLATVPEPATASLLLLAGLASCRRRRP
jgi:hypothetical protein